MSSQIAQMRNVVSRGLRVAPRVTKRTMATEPGAEAKVNCWEAPLEIPKWKEEHIVIAVLAGWGAVIYGAKKAFS
eukprot:CAMPEP_0197495334 /NCGR_PEP_ID=MMETSP1311-20131121/35876_1 /TAXON_ID=464262 /ORGANISM="Genus nov. species nov., Strain RCC856" /LENGTH=74 /DNA_ID=CAMNT_0043040821 /DNA_START=90 /DNA_END=314 /DNA_ORIENTATION=-